jgi:hypothetical protein
MLTSRIHLECDDAHCRAAFPSFNGHKPTPLDGAIYTPRMLRAEAKKRGWQRYGEFDFCPRCEINHRSEALNKLARRGEPARRGEKGGK